MRIIIPDSPEVWAVVGLVLLFAIGFAIYQTIRPPASKRLLADGRYQQALAVYSGHLPREGLTPDDREKAIAAATAHLMTEHGIPAEEAGANLRLVAAEHDREWSYELRHEAIAYEQAGAHQMALEYFERAAQLQEENDPEDYQFLQRCIARVRGKVR